MTLGTLPDESIKRRDVPWTSLLCCTKSDRWPVEDRMRLVQEICNRLVDQGYDSGLSEDLKAELDRRLADDDAAHGGCCVLGGSQGTSVRPGRTMSLKVVLRRQARAEFDEAFD